MIKIDGSAEIIEMGEYPIDGVVKFDFAKAMPYSIDAVTRTCGCTNVEYNRVGSVTTDGVEYPVYRVTGSIRIGVPAVFKRDPNLQQKEFNKGITLFFINEKNETVHKTFKIYYKVVRPKETADVQG